MEVVEWMKQNVKKGEIIMEYRFLERLIYLYDTPTMIVPNDDFETIMNVAFEHRAKYFIVYRDVLHYRPGLLAKWHLRDGEIVAENIPEYMKNS